jgi:uncharacterized protein YcfJ
MSKDTFVVASTVVGIFTGLLVGPLVGAGTAHLFCWLANAHWDVDCAVITMLIFSAVSAITGGIVGNRAGDDLHDLLQERARLKRMAESKRPQVLE